MANGNLTTEVVRNHQSGRAYALQPGTTGNKGTAFNEAHWGQITRNYTVLAKGLSEAAFKSISMEAFQRSKCSADKNTTSSLRSATNDGPSNTVGRRALLVDVPTYNGM